MQQYKAGEFVGPSTVERKSKYEGAGNSYMVRTITCTFIYITNVSRVVFAEQTSSSGGSLFIIILNHLLLLVKLKLILCKLLCIYICHEIKGVRFICLI